MDSCLSRFSFPALIRASFSALIFFSSSEAGLCAEWEGGVMFHCFIGKDRAGTIAGLLLGAVGVGMTDIMMDYSASMSCLRPKYDKMGASFLPQKRGRPDYSWGFFGSVPESMECVWYYLHEKYGGYEGYLKACGVTDETLQKLRDKFLEDPKDE